MIPKHLLVEAIRLSCNSTVKLECQTSKLIYLDVSRCIVCRSEGDLHSNLEDNFILLGGNRVFFMYKGILSVCMIVKQHVAFAVFFGC